MATWVEESLREQACAVGPVPGWAPLRRLNRSQYSATIRELLFVHVDVGDVLPADGAGGEGFDNAAETLFLSPLHAEKYLEAAKTAVDYAMGDSRARQKFLFVEPGDDVGAEEAARAVLDAFLLRAFRRPVEAARVDDYFALYAAARADGDTWDDAVALALQGVLVAPEFLFRWEPTNAADETQLLDGYSLATRLSYFLWGSGPDSNLLGLAGAGVLQNEEELRHQVRTMLGDLRAREFARTFAEQWLGTRELGRDIVPDAAMFPEYHDSTLKAAIHYEPYLFFEEVFREDRSLLEFLDSDWTISSKLLQEHYGLDVPDDLRQNPEFVALTPGRGRGGLLGMAAVLAVSSYPDRTSPVLRGKWVLETLLGEPPPPPPPDVPELEEAEAGHPATLRERLEAHRASAVCASCHDAIDPLGFALEGYDVLGRVRKEENGQPIDSSGALPDGTEFDGVAGLKGVLLQRKDAFVRELTRKMLGYALGRGLTFRDSCTVDEIVHKVKRDAYSSHRLVEEIVLSVPFRFVEGS